MNWKIDPAHSLIQFSVTHMMIAKVRGYFDSFSGTFEIDEERPQDAKITVEIDAASINTRESRRDEHLRSPDFLNAAEYPKLTFKSTSVDVHSRNTATLHGDLTIRGISRPVSLDVVFNGFSKSPAGTTNAGFTAETKINRKDWNLEWNVAIETGGLLVGDEISISIELELIKAE